ncbi:MAG: tight adherence pilus pseudopilin TadF [Symbiopectobacterium sp.]
MFLNKGCIERVNHSLATVLHERTVLYHGKEILTQDDVNQLDLLAKMLLGESHIGEKYNLYIDAIYFDEDIKSEK